MAANIATLERRIACIKQELQELGDLRLGHLSLQQVTCDRPACRCHPDRSRRHGPRYQLGWTRHGHSRTRFIRAPDVPTIEAQRQNHDRLRELVQAWVGAPIQLCDLKLQASRKAARAAPAKG